MITKAATPTPQEVKLLKQIDALHVREDFLEKENGHLKTQLIDALYGRVRVQRLPNALVSHGGEKRADYGKGAPSRPAIDVAELEKIHQMRREGNSHSEIARKTGRSKASVSLLCKAVDFEAAKK